MIYLSNIAASNSARDNMHCFEVGDHKYKVWAIRQTDSHNIQLLIDAAI